MSTPPADSSKASSSAGASAVEFEPPLACVRRILKNSLPSSNVGKDASAAFARACGIFVIYVTACANDFARENKRQTITANDVLAAVKVSKQRLVRSVDVYSEGRYVLRGSWYIFHVANFGASLGISPRLVHTAIYPHETLTSSHSLIYIHRRSWISMSSLQS